MEWSAGVKYVGHSALSPYSAPRAASSRPPVPPRYKLRDMDFQELGSPAATHEAKGRTQRATTMRNVVSVLVHRTRQDVPTLIW